MFSPEQMQAMEALKPPAPPPAEGTPVVASPVGMVRCACNKKDIPLEAVRYHNTGVVQASDSLCRECLTNVRTHSVVVCVKCQAVVARIAPHKDKSGFVFEPRKCYHTDACPGCNPGLQTSKLIERTLFDRARRK